MRMASRIILAREIGKAIFLHALDGARCGARAMGRELAERDLIADTEDVFFLTLEELAGPPVDSFRDLVAQRRADHERYLKMELPPRWTGNPEPVEGQPDVARDEIAAGDGNVERIEGIGIVGEMVTGRARVVSDPTNASFEPGDILVCETTDPSWTPLFMLADALVIDTGGEISPRRHRRPRARRHLRHQHRHRHPRHPRRRDDHSRRRHRDGRDRLRSRPPASRREPRRLPRCRG